MHANVTASYTPPCGGTMAVILVPCTIKSNELGWTWQVVNAQITIANVPVQCSCQVRPSTDIRCLDLLVQLISMGQIHLEV
jgi:hypothetical protein